MNHSKKRQEGTTKLTNDILDNYIQLYYSAISLPRAYNQHCIRILIIATCSLSAEYLYILLNCSEHLFVSV